jgi:ABC-2 type transport system permease protein
MTRLIKTELLKLATVRTFPGILLGALALILVRFAMVAISAGKAEAHPLGTATSTRDLLMAVGSSAILLLVFGILSVTGEVRHGTIGWAFLAVPIRWKVLAAKLTAVMIASAGFLGVTGVTVVGLAAWLLAREGISPSVIGGEVTAAFVGAVVGSLLYAAVGVGLGALIRHQMAALMIPLGWLLVVENLLPSFGLTWVYVWTPGGATAALARADLPGLLSMWVGGLVLFGYAAIAVVIGGRVLSAKDLT